MAPCGHVAALVGAALLTLPYILPIEGLVVRDHNSSHAAAKSEDNAHRSGVNDSGPLLKGVVQDHIRSTSSHAAAERQHHRDRSSHDAAAEKRSHACLAGQRIIFIGPSTSKFDYLAMAYFAEYGKWPVEDQVVIGPGMTGPNPLYEWNVRNALKAGAWLPPEVKAVNSVPSCNAGGGTETFMRYTNHILNKHEVCDCHQNGDWRGVGDLYNSTENRVYTNGTTQLSYFQWFGDIVAPRGTVDVRTMLGPDPANVSLPCPVGQFPGKWAWTLPLPQFLESVVKYMNPSHLIISAAFWPTDPQNTAYWETIAQAGAAAVQGSGGQVYWRTTPQRTDHAQTDPASSVDMAPFLAHGWKMYDARQIVAQYQGARQNDEIYYDFTHLRPDAAGFLGQTWLEQNVCPAPAE